MQTKKLAILGGGTSGLVCALIIKQMYPQLEIELIESSSIGIIGVGEGSTEHWRTFIESVGIRVPDLFNETDCTYKTGIKFTNWNGDGKAYYHNVLNEFAQTNPIGIPHCYAKMIAMDYNPEDMISRNYRESVHYDPIDTSVNQFHFNTFKLNDFLHKVCAERGIKLFDADIEDVILDEQGFVTKLVATDKREFNADFFVDCTGFKRVISGKLGVKWKSMQEYLPMNAALAFPTGNREDIPSYTESTAHDAGWSWRIPTQDRFGNGYVYCDKFISEAQAEEEISKFYKETHGEDITIAKRIKFDAGYVDKFWVKNCVSIGLSGSFVEPLEASSIGTSIQQSFGLATLIGNFERGDETTANKYNKMFDKVLSNIVDYIQLHYFTKRTDTEFWRSCKDIPLTDFNKEYFEYFKKRVPSRNFFLEPYLLFKESSWIMTMHGLGLFDINAISEFWMDQPQESHDSADVYISLVNRAKGEGYSHREVIRRLKRMV